MDAKIQQNKNKMLFLTKNTPTQNYVSTKNNQNPVMQINYKKHLVFSRYSIKFKGTFNEYFHRSHQEDTI